MHAVDGSTTAYGDGRSLLDLPAKPVERPLVWEDHRWNAATRELRPGFGMAVRLGDWKAVRDTPESPVQVYNLKDDPAESRDLSATAPVTARLAALLQEQHTAPLPHLGDMQFVK
jgi:arylsulfatase A-like enzyme